MAESDDPLEKDAVKRLAACRVWKNLWELDFKECYFLTAPHRQRQINSMTQPALQRLLDAPELNTDVAFLIVQDFITEIVNTFMPEAQPWCERGPGMDLPGGRNGDVWKQIAEQVKQDDQAIFGAMKASNLYSEIQKAFYPDLAIGTAAMWIARPHPSRPIVCSALPLRELEVNLGPYGELDDRFAVRYTRNCYVRELLGEEIWDSASVPKEVREKCSDNPQDRTQVSWGFWRKWEEKGDEVWQHVVQVKDRKVHDAVINGEGSCPLLPMRFNPTADWPWGLGPTLMGLPSFRQIDELELGALEAASRSLRPPVTYPADSFASIEQGFEDGCAYPVRPGEQEAIKNIYDTPPPDKELFAYEQKLKTLRKLHFVDFPEQTGDTPPTLGQWLDEMARAQRRIGTPGMPFWREGPAQIFLRFKYLLEAAGRISPVQVDGRAVSLLPYNPAQAAAEQQEVAQAFRAIQMLSPIFPEEWKMYVDGKQTMDTFLAKMRVTLVKMRSADQVQAAVEQISKLIGARQAGNVPQSAQTPGPAAVGPAGG